MANWLSINTALPDASHSPMGSRPQDNHSSHISHCGDRDRVFFGFLNFAG
jgi:hypothetical protein